PDLFDLEPLLRGVSARGQVKEQSGLALKPTLVVSRNRRVARDDPGLLLGRSGGVIVPDQILPFRAFAEGKVRVAVAGWAGDFGALAGHFVDATEGTLTRGAGR